ncbi:secreted protein [Streptomyces davaonensis JCM 4913]|uniref:Secreted protein n=1 Tax=Streptomyces davaonensis (strain DSM 101723 / JCM 4913 / KCC S-0913 / 768) TaxID=1214101 RepID=K4QTB2_STRDJ|nr:DUF3048 domain-containing protein [Streptomyces davaonensis]CCK26096.1 secreted protein [Streptomyces davaonensis JCM 4913]
MGRRARTRRVATITALLATAMTISLAAGCSTPGDGRDDGRAPDKDLRHSPEQTPAAEGSVLAVKIDNVRQAKPQTGLNAADIVYVEQVEGGLSRLMAVYASELPEAVGPVRSARESDLELLRQFDDPTLAFSGAQRKLLPLIDRAPINAQPPGRTSGAYYRGTDKPAPHNLYLRPDRLLPATPGAGALTTGFRYGAAPSGGTADTSETVRYPAARFTFTWSEDRAGWLVSQDGAPTVTSDGERPAPATVVVQYVTIRKSDYHDSTGNYTPYTETIGSGKAKVLRDGRSYDVDWKRAKAADGTDFTTSDGNPVNFAEGQVWVVFAKAS